MEKLTDKNRKDDILKGYNKALEKIKELENQILNPAKEANDKKGVNTVKAAEKTVNENIQELIGTLESQVSKALSNVVTSITSKSEEYNNLQEAISLKKAELKELFEIETNAYSLVALINAQKDSKDKFEVEQYERINELENILSDLRAKIKKEESDFYEKIKEEDKAIKNTRAREEEEYIYNRDRSRRKDEDAFDDKMKVKEKELNLRIQAVEIRENEQAQKDEHIIDLEAKIAAMTEETEEAIVKAKEEGKKEAATSHGFETRYLKKEYESKIELLETKLDLANSTIFEQKDTIEDLTAKLNAAYSEIKDVAIKTVDNSKATDMLNRFERSIGDKSNSK